MLLLLACNGSSPDEGAPVSVYEDLEVWLCHPDKTDDVCDDDLDTTLIDADGTMTVVAHVEAADPAFDCFYLYPTCSLDEDGNSDWEPGVEEEFTVRNQAARFSEVCRVYAPVYRQRTIRALFDESLGGDLDLAFEDTREAWLHYLETQNDGRPVVLVGHSQGAGMIKRLLAEEIELDPAQADLLVGAYPIGSVVRSGDFETPMCSSADETGCAVSYLSFRADEPPDENLVFAEVGSEAACTNPAGIGDGSVELSGVYPTEIPDELSAFIPGGSNPWQEEGPEIETPFYEMPGLIQGECVYDGDFGYLAVSVSPDPDAPRADDIAGDFLAGWGLHLVDVSIAMNDLVDLAERQHAAW